MKLDPQKSLEAMHATGPVLAQARADRVYAEEWKQITGWPEYEVSNYGAVRRGGRQLKPSVMKTGYLMVSLSRYPTRHYRTVHRLVAEMFISQIPDGMDICHNDGDKTNCAVDNLRIDTRKGNMADQIRFGKTPRGEKCGSNKYSQETIVKVKQLLRSGVRPASIARQFCMPKPTVYGISSGRIWGWL